MWGFSDCLLVALEFLEYLYKGPQIIKVILCLIHIIAYQATSQYISINDRHFLADNKLILQYLKIRHCKYYTLYNPYYSITVLNRNIPQLSLVRKTREVTVETISK